MFWPPHLEVDNTLGLNSDSNPVPFWPAPPGQVEKGTEVANIKVSALLSPSLGVSRACTDIDGCTNVQLDDVSDSPHPDENRQTRGDNTQSQ